MRIVAFWIWQLASGLWLASYALASTPATWQGTIDGVDAWITVVPRGHEISSDVIATEPWWAWGNTETDAYLFAFEHPDNVRLILSFALQSSGFPEARLHLNHISANETAPINYTLQGNELQVHSHGGHPQVILRAKNGHWLEDGITNYNLSLLREHDACEANSWQLDGNPFWEHQIGSESPGVPGWETRRRLHDPFPNRICARFGATLRMQGTPPFKLAEPIMPSFPHLGVGQTPSDWYVENQPPLFFQLPNERNPNAYRYQLRLFSFVSFHTGGTYWVNSTIFPPFTNFESPFVFYNFDPSTRQSQLVVRNGGSRIGSGEFPLNEGQQENLIRYSWKMDRDDTWKYGLHLVGFNPYDATHRMTIGDENLFMPSEEAFAPWVVEHPWPLVVFLEAVEEYPGSEGIYFYQPWDAELWRWLHGTYNAPPAALATPNLPTDRALTQTSWEGVPPHFRGEYSAAYFKPPRLYLSPIDYRLHLLHAQGGVWNLTDDRILRVHNLTGNAYIDGWTRERVPEQELEPPPEPTRGAPSPAAEAFDIVGAPVPRALPGDIEEALYLFEDYAIYTGPNGMHLHRIAPLQAATFTIAPPSDKASWLAFRERLRPYQHSARDPHNLYSWLEALPNLSEAHLEGAVLETVSYHQEVPTFTLRLTRASTLSGDRSLIEGAAAPLEPGHYLLAFAPEKQRWTLMRASPAQLEVSFHSALRAYQPGWLEFTVRNLGTLEWSAPASLDLAGTTLQQWDPMTVPGGSELQLRVPWTPRSYEPGELILHLAEETIALGRLQITPSFRPEPLAILRMATLPALIASAAAMLLAFVGALRIYSREKSI